MKNDGNPVVFSYRKSPFPHTFPMKRLGKILRRALCATFCIPVIFACHCSDRRPNDTIAEAALKTVKKTDVVEHVFTHCLIAHPEISFQEGNSYGKHLDRDCLTPSEFRAILEELYQNGYALVNATDTFTIKDGVAYRAEFSFPADKKPLIFSFDDVVYATKNKGKGMSDRLKVNNGEIVAYTQTHDEHREEFVCILEDFIKKHPDFSYRGARGILFLTGFDGILGYRTQKGSKNRETEIDRARPVVQKLRELGWLFGCHSYAHAHMKTLTAEKMRSDCQKWKDEVASIVGETVLYAYPYGEWVFGADGKDERQTALNEAGFKVFYGVGENAFYTKMPLTESSSRILFQDRCALDGVSLRRNNVLRFFNASKIYDNRRPIPFSATE